MTVTFKYEAEINEFEAIPAGSECKVVEDWNEYEGFTAVSWKGKQYYFNNRYFVEELSKVLNYA